LLLNHKQVLGLNLPNHSLLNEKEGQPMRIIAFITNSHEVAKILKHIGEQTSRAPPLMPTDPVPSSCDFDDTNFQHTEVS